MDGRRIAISKTACYSIGRYQGSFLHVRLVLAPVMLMQYN